jgi:hypothetical protein
MRSNHVRVAIAGLAALAIVAGVLAAGFAASSESARTSPQLAYAGEGVPLGAKIAAQAAPPGANAALEGEREGAGGLIDATDPLAYPAADVALSSFQAARSAGLKANGKLPTGKGRKGTWVSIGPDTALNPDSFVRRGYIPTDYITSGRTPAMVIAPTCKPGDCRLWIGAAGGGVWRTKNALAGTPHWEFLTSGLPVQTVGTLYADPNDASGNTIWLGTGEPNTCGSGCGAGIGLFKSTDGGDTWSGPFGRSVFESRGIGAILVKPGDPNTMYASSTRAIRGYASVCCDGVVSVVPGAAKWGLYKSSDGGQNWTFIHNGAATVAGCTGDQVEVLNGTPCSPRGVRRVVFDPYDSNTLYASSYARGIWRSTDAGATWTQIKAALIASPTNTTDISSIAVTKIAGGATRMYVGQGPNSQVAARFYRSDNASSAAPTFTQLSSADPADTGYGAHAFCTSQCTYDNYVYTPAGHPDTVYLLGSYTYPETAGGRNLSNGRAVVLSTDAGVSWNDMTMDGTARVNPNGLHPDEHIIVTNPNNPFQFFQGGDGGVVRTTGEFVDASATCEGRTLGGVPLTPVQLARCKQLLSRVPALIESLNKGLSTLQFQSLSVSPLNPNVLQGGTQDNGTWGTDGNPNKWINEVHGDGGQSGFDAANDYRFETLFTTQITVNFDGGVLEKWIWVSDPFFLAPEPAQFYIPVIGDPVVSKTMYTGLSHVWRTKTWGLGTRSYDEAQAICNAWTGTDPNNDCGDWLKLGDPTPAGSLTSATYGATKPGGSVAAVERGRDDTSTLWAATSTGRLFVSKNADAEPASAVTFRRIDTDAQPQRFVSGIYVDPTNANHAWVSYSGFNASTPGQQGHLFEVTFNGTTASFTRLDGTLGDLPLTDVVRDEASGDLYVSNDFGVLRLAAGETEFTAAAPGLPTVEVPGLTIVQGKRILYAATHGLGAWRLNLS